VQRDVHASETPFHFRRRGRERKPGEEEFGQVRKLGLLRPPEPDDIEFVTRWILHRLHGEISGELLPEKLPFALGGATEEDIFECFRLQVGDAVPRMHDPERVELAAILFYVFRELPCGMLQHIGALAANIIVLSGIEQLTDTGAHRLRQLQGFHSGGATQTRPFKHHGKGSGGSGKRS